MEGLVRHTPMIDHVRNRGAFDREPFVLIDVGCSGGIDESFRLFGPSLIAHGYDPNITACEDSQRLEQFAHVKYHPRFVGLPESHPFHQRRVAEQKQWPVHPWDRVTVGSAAAWRQREAGPLTGTRLADISTMIGVDAIVEQEQLATVDFLKIDVDGSDLDVLESAKPVFGTKQVLGVGVEVNWVGTASRLDHTFHNTDLFLREQGYTLFSFTSRLYPRNALPGGFLADCLYAQTTYGQPFQGDAVYVRDLVAPHERANVGAYPAEKLLKLACIYELIGLPDCAAEAVLHFRDRLETLGDPEALLDALTPPLLGEQLTYRQYMEKFEKEPHLFMPSGRAEWERKQAAAREAARRAEEEQRLREMTAARQVEEEQRLRESREQWLREMIAARGGFPKRFARLVKRVLRGAA